MQVWILSNILRRHLYWFHIGHSLKKKRKRILKTTFCCLKRVKIKPQLWLEKNADIDLGCVNKLFKYPKIVKYTLITVKARSNEK